MARISYKDAYDNESVIAQIAALADDCDSATDAATQASADAAAATETATAAVAKIAAATEAAAAAQATAETAQATADTAKANAATAQSSADAASNAAYAAQTAASAAKTAADAAATKAATAINANPASIATAFNTSTRVLTTTINPVSGDPLTATATIPGGSSGGSAYEEITTFDPSTWHQGDLALIKTMYYSDYGTSYKYNWGSVETLGDNYLQIAEFAVPRYETAITNQLLIEGVSIRFTSIDAKEVSSIGTKLVFDTSAGTVTPGQYDASTAYATAFTKQIVGRISVSGT